MLTLVNAQQQQGRRRALAIPEVPNVEPTCKQLLSQSKHALQDMFDIANEFMGNELRNGFFSELTERARVKYGDDDTLYRFLVDTKPFREFIRFARNCIEHEKPKQRVVISNLRMVANGEVLAPTFQLIHPKYPANEIPVNELLTKIFSDLVDFSESLIVGLVARHMDPAKLKFPIEVMQCTGGYHGNLHIRYCYGVRFADGVRPLG
jgi:hypothetical protein